MPFNPIDLTCMYSELFFMFTIGNTKIQKCNLFSGAKYHNLVYQHKLCTC